MCTRIDPITRQFISQIGDHVDEAVIALLLDSCPPTVQTLTWTFVRGKWFHGTTVDPWTNLPSSGPPSLLTSVGMEAVTHIRDMRRAQEPNLHSEYHRVPRDIPSTSSPGRYCAVSCDRQRYRLRFAQERYQLH